MNSTILGKPTESDPAPILLDGLLQSFLLGTIVNQAFKYLMNYRDDSWSKRAFVSGVIFLSFLQTMLEDYKVWRTLILHRPWSTSPIEWSDLFINGCICWLCEGFYIRRCWKMMDKSYWILAPLSVLSILIMAANLYLAIAMGIAFRDLEGTNDTLTASHFILPSTIVAFSFWIFGSLIIEITVTTISMISLWRSRTGLREVDKTLVNIIHITWESALLPSISMIVAVGLYHAAPRLDDHFVLFFVLLTGKFYAFGMLRALNSRERLRQRMSHDFGRTSLNAWDWNQTTAADVSANARLESSVNNTTISFINFGTLPKEVAPNEIAPNENPFASSVQTSTPFLDAQEGGAMRHRICSGEDESSGETFQEIMLSSAEVGHVNCTSIEP